MILGKKNQEKKYVDKGKRLDGRKTDELRQIDIEVGVIDQADGSAFVQWGKNKVYAAVYGPKECLPRHTQNPLKAVLRYKYNMAPFSVSDRIRPGYSRRSVEISKVSRLALEKTLVLEDFPKTAIDVFVEIIQADAGSRAAGITAASVALADAGIPMTGLVSACAVGKAGGHIILDMTKEEEDAPDAIDLPVAYVPETGEFTLVQMDGELQRKDWDELIELAVKGCEMVGEKQRLALKKKYEGEVNE
ncbi:MAG: exosome complex exonuclease Rrp41 [Candidatus Diapherotrites archaeon]|nr:exosome complex exonuclease Rrp41 [Candidatus Diapherotrites archaeon]